MTIEKCMYQNGTIVRTKEDREGKNSLSFFVCATFVNTNADLFFSKIFV